MLRVSLRTAQVSNGRAKKGRRTNDGDEEEGVFLISYLDCRRDTTFVMGRYEWDWERLGRLNFEIPLIASPPSLFIRLAFAGAVRPLFIF